MSAHDVLSILGSVVVSLCLSTDIFKLQRNLVASYPILVVLSLEISTIVVDRICQRESAECIGKQVVHSEWVKGTMLLQALSRTDGRWAAEHAWLLQSGYSGNMYSYYTHSAFIP